MLLLHKIFLFSLLVLLAPQTTQTSKQELNDQLFEAVRKGDAAGVTAALDKGADVNAKFRYGATALFKAAERGNAGHVLSGHGDDVGARRQTHRCREIAVGKGRRGCRRRVVDWNARRQ